MPHSIHTSERRSFRACRRRHKFAYVDGYVPVQQPRPLEFGIAFHIGMEQIFEPATWDVTTPEQKAEAASRAFSEECDKQRAQYLRMNELTELPAMVEEDYEARVQLGTGMFEYYVAEVHPRFDSWFRPVYVEVPFSVQIDNPDDPGNPLRCTASPYCGQGHSNDPTSDDSLVLFEGRVDAIVQHRQHGGYFIWDHKTAATVTADLSFLDTDDQISSYCWALGHVLNIDIRGFIYQQLRKDYPKPPKILKRSRNGKILSTDKNQATDAALFQQTAEECDPEAWQAGLYAEYMAYLQASDAALYYTRSVVRKSRDELVSVGHNISMEAADMVDRNVRRYPNASRFSCNTCAYREPCISMNRNEDHLYYLSTEFLKTNKRYWMEQKPSSDK